MTRYQALVSDTHPILYHANGGRRLSPIAAAHFDACDRIGAVGEPVAVVVDAVAAQARLARRRRAAVCGAGARILARVAGRMRAGGSVAPVSLTRMGAAE